MLLAFAILPQRFNGDDGVRAVMIRQLASGIKPETKYSFIQPVVSVPLYWTFHKLGFGVFALTLIPMIWLAVWSAVVWRIVAPHRSPLFAHVTIVLSVASLLGAYLVGFNSDIFSALGMTGGLLAGLLGKSRAARRAGWLVYVVTAANTPVMVAVAVVTGLVLVVRRRQFRFLLLPVAVFGATVVEATAVSGKLGWTRYSSAIEHGNMQLLPWGEIVGFNWPLWSGLLAILFSFGRGLVFFFPLSWLGPSRRRDELTRVEHLLWLSVVVLIPVYAKWWAWYGGVSFGPRFFMIAIVPTAMGCASAITDTQRSTLRSLVILVAIFMSVWVAATGAIYGVTTTAFDACVSGGTFANEALCLYTPEYSGLWAPIWARDPTSVRDVIFVIALVLFVAPTVCVVVAPTIEPLKSMRDRGLRHLRQPWNV